MKPRAIRAVLLTLALLASTVSAHAANDIACATSAWRWLFTSGPHGEDAGGNRRQLIDALRRGSPLRVGWGEADADGQWSVEELSDATFVNIMGGKDVVAQLEPALIQNNYTDATIADLKAPLIDWHAIASTDGRFSATMTDRQSGDVIRHLVQRTHFHWYAFAPDPACDTRTAVQSAPKGRRNEQTGDSRHTAAKPPAERQ